MSQYFDNDKNIKSERKIIKFNFDNKVFSIYSDNGVFSKDRFDYGTRVLLNSVDIDKLSGNVLDLGCGLGVVGIILGTFNKCINIDMVDINERAISLIEYLGVPNSYSPNSKDKLPEKLSIGENVSKTSLTPSVVNHLYEAVCTSNKSLIASEFLIIEKFLLFL